MSANISISNTSLTVCVQNGTEITQVDRKELVDKLEAKNRCAGRCKTILSALLILGAVACISGIVVGSIGMFRHIKILDYIGAGCFLGGGFTAYVTSQIRGKVSDDISQLNWHRERVIRDETISSYIARSVESSYCW